MCLKQKLSSISTCRVCPTTTCIASDAQEGQIREGVAYTLVDPTDEQSLTRILERLPADGRPEDLTLSTQVEIEETPPWEAKAMARTIDFQKRKADPTYKGLSTKKAQIVFERKKDVRKKASLTH